ncbi:hypothetical protein [Actinacidiphila cocklensis]|uniref:hypothetical protein n=1 Tax=Actinacidiphila cocklensis TaxID=887465 RepID=UPI003BEF3C4C
MLGEHGADRLDAAEAVPVLVDERHERRCGRSSSAAKKADLDSTGQGNTLGWCAESEALARTVVQLGRDGVKVVLAEGRQVGAFWARP